MRDERPRRGVPRPGPSAYEHRFPTDDDERSATVAESDPVTGVLCWLPDWERRVQGWVPLGEFLRGRWRA